MSLRRQIGKLYVHAWRAAQIHLFRNRREMEVARWIKDNGDDTLRLNYPLNSDSLVFDLGGYSGDWAARIMARYQCRVFVFEPIPQFCQSIKKRFATEKRAFVYCFGLHSRTEVGEIAVDQNASSRYRASRSTRSQDAQFVDIKEFIDRENIQRIDLMKINIEGGEYDLLERILELGLAYCIANIQVQFHDFVADAASRRDRIRTALRATHEVTYEYAFVWENWRRLGARQ